MPEACCYSAMAGLNDEVWVIGGSAPAGTNCWVYDAASGERRDGPSLPAPRMGCIGAAVDGRVYVIGGSGAATLSLCPCLAFVPSLSWQIEYPCCRRKRSLAQKKSAVFSSAGGFGVLYPALTKAKNGLNPGTSYRAQARTWCDPAGGAYRSAAWSPLVFWSQPSVIRLANPNLTEKNLLRITDLLGREVNPNTVIHKTTLLYIYDTGVIEKRIIFE